MAATKTSALPASPALAAADLIAGVDVSDTSVSPTGLNVKVTAAQIGDYAATHTIATLPFTTVPGLVEGGTGDNTAAINAALDACHDAGGGVVVLPAGNYGWDDEIIVPEWVDLQGAGGGWSASPTNHMTRLVATGTDAKISFESSGGTSGSFVVDGDGTATGPIFHRKLGAERMFQSIHIRQSDGEGWRIDEAQNDTWINVQSYGHAGACQVLDNGCGGHMFIGCEIAGTDAWHIVIDETTGTGPYLTIGPSHNTWDHCLIEYANGATFDGCLDIHSGHRNVFRDCVFSASGYETNVGLVRTNTDAAGGGGTSSVQFDGSWFFGADSGSQLGIVQTAGIIRVSGNTVFQELTTAWTYDGGTAKVADEITYVAVTNEWAGSGSTATIVNNVTRPIEVRGLSTDSYLLRVLQRADSGTRLDISPLGAFAWGGGSGAPDAVLWRPSAGLMQMLVGSLDVGGAWNGPHLRMGVYHLWVDSTGDLRIMSSAPASDTDGTVVGTQS